MKSQKGSQFERAICKTLSLWFSDGTTDDLFWRSSQSGGRAKTRSKTGKSTFGSYGDIAAVHPSGLALTQSCILELKRGYKQWSIMDVLDAKPRGRAVEPAKQTFELFIDQMEEDKKISGIRYCALIFQRDQRHAGIAIETDLLMKMRSHSGPINFPFLRYRVRHDFMITTLDYFLDWASPSFFAEYYKELSK